MCIILNEFYRKERLEQEAKSGAEKFEEVNKYFTMTFNCINSKFKRLFINAMLFPFKLYKSNINEIRTFFLK
jgi:hypothetical protein